MEQGALRGFRGLIRRYPLVVPAAGWFAIFVVLLVVGILVDGRVPVAAVNSAILATAYLVVPLGIALIKVHRARREVIQGKIFGYLRDPHAPPGSLGAIWNPGEAVVTRHSVRFQPRQNLYGPESGAERVLEVAGVAAGRRYPAREEAAYLTTTWPAVPREIVTLHMSTGDLEFAAVPEALELFLQRLTGVPGDH